MWLEQPDQLSAFGLCYSFRSTLQQQLPCAAQHDFRDVYTFSTHAPRSPSLLRSALLCVRRFTYSIVCFLANGHWPEMHCVSAQPNASMQRAALLRTHSFAF